MYRTTATSDSVDGRVSCYIGATQTSIRTTFNCKAGDVLQILVNESKPVVIGVIGTGDRINAEIEQAQTDITHNTSDLEYVALMTDVDIWDNQETSNEYSKAAQIAKKNFDSGLWSIARINKLLEAGKITEEEYRWIVGENKQATKNKK